MKDVLSQTISSGDSYIRLSLSKPRDWKVALTTTVSTAAITPPSIRLWDADRGALLMDTGDHSTPRIITEDRKSLLKHEKTSHITNGRSQVHLSYTPTVRVKRNVQSESKCPVERSRRRPPSHSRSVREYPRERKRVHDDCNTQRTHRPWNWDYCTGSEHLSGKCGAQIHVSNIKLFSKSLQLIVI